MGVDGQLYDGYSDSLHERNNDHMFYSRSVRLIADDPEGFWSWETFFYSCHRRKSVKLNYVFPNPDHQQKTHHIAGSNYGQLTACDRSASRVI